MRGGLLFKGVELHRVQTECTETGKNVHLSWRSTDRCSIGCALESTAACKCYFLIELCFNALYSWRCARGVSRTRTAADWAYKQMRAEWCVRVGSRTLTFLPALPASATDAAPTLCDLKFYQWSLLDSRKDRNREKWKRARWWALCIFSRLLSIKAHWSHHKQTERADAAANSAEFFYFYFSIYFSPSQRRPSRQAAQNFGVLLLPHKCTTLNAKKYANTCKLKSYCLL